MATSEITQPNSYPNEIPSSFRRGVDSVVENDGIISRIVRENPVTRSIAQFRQARADRKFETQLGQVFPIQITQAIYEGNISLPKEDQEKMLWLAHRDWSNFQLDLDNPKDRELAAFGMANGFTVFTGFGNFYAVMAHPHPEAMKYVNLDLKGRLENRTGSVTASQTADRDYIQGLIDESRLPGDLPKDDISEIMADFYRRGPAGFRVPAKAHIGSHLTGSTQIGETSVVNTQIIYGGYNCPSNELIRLATEYTESKQNPLYNYFFITSANPSHDTTGQEEPAHHRMSGIQKDFGKKKGVIMIGYEREREDEVKAKYPDYDPQSVSILDLTHLETSGDQEINDDSLQRLLSLARQGSLDPEKIEPILNRHGYSLKVPKGLPKLAQRVYPD